MAFYSEVNSIPMSFKSHSTVKDEMQTLFIASVSH